MTKTTRQVVLALASIACAACGGSADPAPTPEPPVQRPVLPPLVLRDVIPDLTAIAATAAARPGDDRMAELRDLLETGYLPGAPARAAALAQRSLAEDPDVDWILEDGLTQHEDATIRAQCAFLLGERHRPAALPVLLLRMKYEKDAVVQAWVIGALAKLANWGGLDQLAALIYREDSAQRAGLIAIEILTAAGRDPGEAPSYAQIVGQLAELEAIWWRTGVVANRGQEVAEVDPRFEDLDPELRARMAQRLLVMTEEPLRPVDDARFVFIRMGRVGVPMLARAMGAGQEYLRAHVLEIAQALGRPASALAPQVLPLLADPLTSSTAARALGSLRYAPALGFLVDRLGDESIEARAAAAAGLGLLEDTAALDPLLARLRDLNESIDVRVEAAGAVARLDVGRRFLLERIEVGDYHEPTVREMLDAIDARRAQRRN